MASTLHTSVAFSDISVLLCCVSTDQMERSSGSESGGYGDFAVEVLRAMARGFRRYVDSIASHSQYTTTDVLYVDTCDSATDVLDNWPEKLSAWRAALYVSGVVLQTDLELVGTALNCQPGKSLQHQGRLIVGHL